MTLHITSPDQLDHITDTMQAQMVKDAETRLALAKKIRFHHGVGVGNRVFIAYRRAAGVIEELLVRHPNPNGSCAPHGVFRVRLDDGRLVEEFPDHLTISPTDAS